MKKKQKIDYGGALSFTIGITALLLALLSLDTGESGLGLSKTGLYMLLGIAIVFLILFFIIQRRHSEPMIPLQLFRIKDVSISVTAAFLTSMILIGLTAYLPLWTQNVLNMGATSSGITLIPLCIGWPAGSLLCGRLLIPRFGIKQAALFGAVLISIGSLLLTMISPTTSLILLAIFIFITGFGFGLATTSYTVIIQSTVPAEMRGSAGSLNSLLRTLWQTIGVAVLGTSMNFVINSVNDNKTATELMAEGLHVVFLISAIISVLSLIVTTLIPKRSLEEYKY